MKRQYKRKERKDIFCHVVNFSVDNDLKGANISHEIRLFLFKINLKMKKVLSVFKNKYVLTLLILIVWVAFFDKNDLKTQLDFKKQVAQLTDERNYYAKEIHEITTDINELYTNPKTLEKFAREKYLMKRDNEDIFVLVEEKK